MAQKPLSENTDYRSFRVTLIGADRRDEITLERLLGITRYRTRRYQLTSVAIDAALDYAQDVVRSSEIIMVNINSPEAIFLWSRLASTLPPQQRKPVIRITREKQPKSDPNLTVSWPINPTRVIQTLDRYTVNHLNFVPEFEIGNDNGVSAKVVSLPKRQSPASNQPQRESAPLKALVADDSLAVRRQLEMEFEHLGCALTLVSDGDAALEAARKERFDIIFLDVIMPGLDGYSVCKGIRRDALNRQTPVVLLTSKSSRFDKLKGKMSGCDTYLTKPINHNEFCSITERHLRVTKPT